MRSRDTSINLNILAWQHENKSRKRELENETWYKTEAANWGFLGCSMKLFLLGSWQTFQEIEVQKQYFLDFLDFSKHLILQGEKILSDRNYTSCSQALYNYCFLEHLIKAGGTIKFLLWTPHFARRDNFPKHTIEFPVRTPHATTKAIFGFLQEHLFFQHTHPSRHLFLQTKLFGCFRKARNINISMILLIGK